MVRFTLRIPKQLNELIEKRAKLLGISKNSVIVTLLWSQIDDFHATNQNKDTEIKKESTIKNE